MISLFEQQAVPTVMRITMAREQVLSRKDTFPNKEALITRKFVVFFKNPILKYREISFSMRLIFMILPIKCVK